MQRARQGVLGPDGDPGQPSRGRSGPDEADRFVLPVIPDYVDGSFRTGQA